MNYYKAIHGNEFIGVATQSNFRFYQSKHRILLACEEDEAEYIQIEDILYHSDWMNPVNTDKYEYEIIDLVSIEEDEYNTLCKAIETGDEITIDVEPEQEEISVPDSANDVTVEFLKSTKISEMSNICNKTITSGIDIVLSDGTTHHFSLTTQDQLNLITLSALAESGETTIPYHADDELCKFYSVEDIKTIISKATTFKTYHVSYFNALKKYIESLEEMDTIATITYGIEIPEDYQSEVLKALLSQVGD